MPVSRCAAGQFQAGPDDRRGQNHRDAEPMDRHARQARRTPADRRRSRTTGRPSRCSWPGAAAAASAGRAIQKQKPASVSTAYGRRPASSLRRISSTHGTGAIQASGHQSSGGSAAQSNSRAEKGHYPRRTRRARRRRTKRKCTARNGQFRLPAVSSSLRELRVLRG